jgi:hypothetical protein
MNTGKEIECKVCGIFHDADDEWCSLKREGLGTASCYAVKVLSFDFIYNETAPPEIKKDVKWVEDFYFELMDQREIGNHSWEMAHEALEESRAEWLKMWVMKIST